ncbi:MAG TPA: hypothetical protein VMU11_01880 [Verrucomicrobiae bacterium]|nr:hypothetical protein [Verrucomicrobiae bacterium]
MKQIAGLLFLVCILPIALLVMVSERPECSGHTDIPTAAQHLDGWNGPGLIDNYAVFREGRRIRVLSGLWPFEIEERDGEIVHVSTIMARRWPIRTYTAASSEEQRLWRRYFEPDDS